MENETLISNLNKLLTQGIEFQKEWRLEWRNNRDFYLLKQWDNTVISNKPTWRHLSSNNAIPDAIRLLSSLISDQRPICSVQARANGDHETERTLNDLMTNLWDDLKIEELEHDSLISSMIYGSSFKKVYWDSKKKDIAVALVPIENLVIDPHALDLNDARFVAEKIMTPLSSLIAQYPKLATELRSRASTNAIHDSDLYTHRDFPNRDLSHDGDDPRVSVWEFWFRDNTLEPDAPIHDRNKEVDSSIIRKKNKAYPNGRVVKFVGNLVLEDRKNPFNFHGDNIFPYVKTDYNVNVTDFYGVSLIGPCKHLSHEINVIGSRIADSITVNASSRLLVREGALDLDYYTNAPESMLILKSEIGESLSNVVSNLPSNNLSIDVYHHYSDLKQQLRASLGITSSLEGSQGSSARTGAIRASFSAASSPLRQTIRNQNTGLSELGSKMLDLVKQYYELDRVVFLTNPNLGILTYEGIVNDKNLSSNVREALSNSEVKKALQSPLRKIVLNETNLEAKNIIGENIRLGFTREEALDSLRLKGILEVKNDVRKSRYKYKVMIGPNQGNSKEDLQENLLRLLQYSGNKASVLLPHLIKALDFPNARDIISELNENEELRTQLASLQKQLEESQKQPVQNTQSPVGILQVASEGS